jgi:imidazolonepropionase
LRPLEALAAATVNSAHVLGLGEEVGRLQPGHRADVVVLDTPDLDHLTYRPDTAHVLAVVCAGELAYVSPQAEGRWG